MQCLEENTIVALADGRLGPAELAKAETHARQCTTCHELLRGALQGTESADWQVRFVDLDAPLVAGTRVGRYTVLQLVGSGGMGKVYAAYDPQLDRKIALKLLHARAPGRSAQAEDRLLREAKAIAKLSHPNVVGVHDVGAFKDKVFLAMEFVEGSTLTTWLKEQSRSHREILGVFVAAARGLSAAHRAGLVHRDFKPQNVMVGLDGSVRVMDFGLARQVNAAAAPAAAGDATVDPNVGTAAFAPAELSLTETGQVLGTPQYMAPEQFVASATDGRTDQFSFCVALYWALYGMYPFGGSSAPGLLPEILQGRLALAPTKTDVPARLRRILVRGLAANPGDRWGSMETLIGELERDPSRRWKRTAAIALPAAAAALVTLAAVRGAHRPESLCVGGQAHLQGVWETEPESAGAGSRREAVRAALARAEGAGGGETWGRVAPILNRYAGEWLGMYRTACEATHVRGEQSAEVLDLRMACLEQRRDSMRALVDVLAAADGDVAANAVKAANELPGLERCADVSLLRATVEPPRDRATQQRVDSLRRQLATATALHHSGKSHRAIQLGNTLLADARALGYAPAIAEIILRIANFEAGSFLDARVTEASLEETLRLALAWHRDDLAAEAATDLVGFAGYKDSRPQEAARWAGIALALWDRLGSGHQRERSWLLQNQAASEQRAGQLGAALKHVREALALKKKVLSPDDPDIAASLDLEANLLAAVGDPAAALERNREGYELVVRAYGEATTNGAMMLSNRGEYLLALGRPQEARPLLELAAKRFEAQVGPDGGYLAYPLVALGQSLLDLGQPDAALPHLERALRLREASEPNAELVAQARFSLARALWNSRNGSRPRAIALATRARTALAGGAAHAKDLQVIEGWLKERTD